jgi:hypothetical protein
MEESSDGGATHNEQSNNDDKRSSKHHQQRPHPSVGERKMQIVLSAEGKQSNDPDDEARYGIIFFLGSRKLTRYGSRGDSIPIYLES